MLKELLFIPNCLGDELGLVQNEIEKTLETVNALSSKACTTPNTSCFQMYGILVHCCHAGILVSKVLHLHAKGAKGMILCPQGSSLPVGLDP